ncbi:hypothetical protein [Bradyrhizobium sp. CCGUVB14]|uniref:hypothetical protein n=1 Tax=Bradyrhizobium sp. CCGUVB14 TaxID=2949628 RepID=UPI0020B31D95|nr:hypothetical protein [Bradyrhizobium sp. CCGUVB14]MCP3444585.1 hypothetical protein [Bradyrhizobium sp. CCGUVB14]
MRTDITASISAVNAKCDALAEDVKASRKADEAGERDRGVDGTMAERVAADSVGRSEFAALASSVAGMQRKQTRPMADLNAFADVQAKADAVMRALGSAAEPPMAGEDLVAYKIRTTRKMQSHSPRWKGVELQIIAADHVALDNVINEIRSDAMAASMSTEGMREFEHRKITKTMPGGHTVYEFVGNGTIFKQLSRPVRHVAYIGTRTGTVQ